MMSIKDHLSIPGFPSDSTLQQKMACKLGVSGDRPPEIKILTETMSELAISSLTQPPPSKIR
jgi:hypothetical protein